ncbi:bacteriocin immunity protein [Streptococcus oricebi]|uniref:Bacteriocin immunity protein n=1 Tax=Streptococcus oricebi TaxID=1547447 RepID=A0ABS5B4G2_9STRE|nr:bacteriocin immunity protein [Streptococcus oricebi]MBP2623717.1 bacteriocin immunity protein [Streptococcus oricebi]
MTKKIKEEDILQQIDQLISDTDILENERRIFLTFKKAMDKKQDFEGELAKLVEDLRQLAVQNIQKERKLSPRVKDFYLSLASHDLFKKNLARGLINPFLF